MLVLTRKAGQSIVIDDEVEITIVEVKGDQVRLGIKAPPNISIYRKEIYEEIRAANRAAVTTSADFSMDSINQVLEEAAKAKGKPLE